MRLLPSTLAFALLLGAIPLAQSPTLDGSAWTLATLAGYPSVQGTVTLRFEADHVSGNDGCNSYRGHYTGEGVTFRVGPLTSTYMACREPRMRQAAAFTEALGKARVTRFDEGRLVLVDEAGAVLATFTRQSASLAGTTWEVTAYNNRRQAVVSVLADTRVTLAFGAEGRVTGEAGCNRFAATYTAEGESVAIGTLSTTRRTCPGEGVMAQEAAFLAALASGTRARMDGDRLELRTTDGALAVSARRF
ncbi:META domain-containing protein [Luteitalea sp. TBR-22]|uniref:META domain-containing protein n=1 Tax=Luteitalea sp. TBR-22 TaxID=2802971 RepID=UPI001AFA4B76|nr:META domain-containing protein [Luteitalea sp. TBR-22]BCS31805.1 META domain-containing protein [Luteitalea sp. TBR-22]